MAKQPTKKTVNKTVAKKATTKPVATKKTAVKKTAVKKVAAKKIAAPIVAAKKIAAPKVATTKPATKSVAKKATPKPQAKAKASLTRILVKADVGFGNELHLRGAGGGLSWDFGTDMENISADKWLWQGDVSAKEVVFKVLLNDTVWSEGNDYVVSAGDSIDIEPEF